MWYLKQVSIWHAANPLFLPIEQVVRQFPHYHQYTLGTEFRRQAMPVCQLILQRGYR